jgi:hypothetical protein
MSRVEELRSSRRGDLERAHRRLQDKHLLRADADAVSVLLPGLGRMLYRAKSDAAPRELPLRSEDDAASLHGQVYAARPDAGALATLTTAAARALATSRLQVPIVFDEQARHIGETWRGDGLGDLVGALGAGANAGLLGERLLIIGVTPNRMIFNAELFEKCAQAYLLARGDAPGRRTYLVPWWVRLIAGRRLRRDQRAAARQHAAGNPAPELTAY